ncbi:hypothetical protein [Humisphaera borealis]|uniref:Uncharacterized protein n=1 Tax=Humisphaera borealis TaxID=2807512 RepID=A0A7M2X0K6_9BACT|nr:hypothetical protein [Humisphaera borealis]QOV91296.1 hypothetical protein IPV69_08045 [Humisphaera borealis]
MLSTDTAISRLRRDLTLGVLIKALMLGAGVTSLIVLPLVAPQVHSGLAMLAVGVIWLVLSYNSAKSSRLAADAPALIGAGDYEEAERQIEQALSAFSLFRMVKLQTVHHLALLRYAQKRFRDVSELCRELLAQRGGSAGASLSKPTRLLLADAMLELDDVRGTYDALVGLYGQRLTLNEVLKLMAAQLDYESRVGAWSRMMNEVMTKVQLAELMPSAAAARTQALLSVAAKRCGRADFSDWLKARAALLVAPAKLVAQRPLLAELWPSTAPDVD